MNARERRLASAAPALLLMFLLVLGACAQEKDAQQRAAPQEDAAQTKARASVPAAGPAAGQVSGVRAMQYVRDIVKIGPRPVGSPGHARVETYLRAQLKDDNLEEDNFTAQANGRPTAFRNFIVKFPGSKDGTIVIAGHYDTKPIKNFVGANDGGSSAGLLLELARQFHGKKRDGYAVWLVWLDGEEAISESNAMDMTNSLYGSRHLADKWRADGTLKKVKAFILLDMIGDADLSLERDTNSTSWLQDVVLEAAKNLGYQSHFFVRPPNAILDDHVPFANAGVPVVDLIDLDYGFNNVFWHTPEDTLDKLSPKSLEVVGNAVLQTIGLLDSR